ncbi:MAG: NADPH-dependent FMN reductase [Solirubrobacteraceae bacterium]
MTQDIESHDGAPLSLLAIIGSVTPPGRLRRAVSEALHRHAATAASPGASLIDLGERRVSFASGAPLESLGDDSAEVVAAIVAAESVVLATPVYRGTLSGSLKNLLDLVPVHGLQGKAVGIVAMGATDHHSLGADWHLRDVLAWFGAIVAPVSVYLTSRDFEDGVPAARAATALDELLDGVTGLAAALSSLPRGIGPAPLAAQSLAGRRQ